ncbi:MAG: porin [Hyphomicrobiales bacterium]
MTLAKRLLLGTAAAFVATSGAHAADLGLPVAPSVDYVQICSIGSFTGFILPGSDVCFEIGGFARFQADWRDEYRVGLGAVATVNNDELIFQGIGNIHFDARTMTEWGLLRGYVELEGGGRQDNGGAIVEKAFLQIGGLVAGLTDSFFDPVYSDYALVGGYGGDDDRALIGYNFSVGNGVTIGFSLEDAEHFQNVGPAVVAAGMPAINTAYDASYTLPDAVANIRVSQAWGSAAIYAVLHENDANTGNVGTEYGYAVGASAEINLPFGMDSSFGIFGTYADGAVAYAGLGGHDFEVVGTSIRSSTAYTIGAGFDFGLTSEVSVQLEGTYSDFDAVTNAYDYNGYNVRGSVSYTPITNLTIQAGVFYQDWDTNYPVAVATPNDDNDFGGRLRITRSF